MKKNKKSRCYLYIKLSISTIVISSFIFNACIENPGEFTIGEEFIESKTNLALIDTFSVSLSTVILDTIICNGTGSLLIGNYSDEYFGKVSSMGYLQIGVPDSYNFLDDEKYDSLSLIIKYNNYSYGDTAKSQKISVHQLTEKIEYSYEEVIPSQTSFSFNSNPIGSIKYIPKPNSLTDSLSIRISDDIGHDLFTKLKENSEIITDNETFIKYFHGLVIKAEDTQGAIVGFQASTDDVRLVLYTSREVLTTENKFYEFGLYNITKQFNNITHNFSSTQLSNLVEQQTKLSNTKTGGLSFLQGGTGLTIKIDFPSLSDILLFERGIIMEAELSIHPLVNSYNNFSLPSELFIYKANNQNSINDELSTEKGYVASSTLDLNELYEEETIYNFDVTDYINEGLGSSYIDPEKGLLISLSSDNLQKSFYRLIIDAQNKKTNLKIYYLTY